jgi:hypothetical protein
MWLIISNFEAAPSSEYDLTSFDTRGMRESLLEHAFPHLHAKIAKSFLTITHRSVTLSKVKSRIGTHYSGT